ncbi:MAG TPA: polysaccharide deacetylase family protein [Thermoanaerobaculia bacterium]|jgi:peptidoglycan/xylan/chitin deacetylase (PgdA/CDA1 family)|nr:polysaccharide deacetylase family protein [Thermoanaerobaculia bacterium]
MRALILTFATGASIIVPIVLLLGFPPSWPIALGILALSHALVLWPTLSPNSQWLGPVMTSFETDTNEVWLTIDDGPTEDTPALLDALDALGVKATFFVKGVLVEQRPDLVTAILAHGHGVENHSQTHPSGTFWCLPRRRVAWQIDQCSKALENVGVSPRLFRAPVGMKNPFVHAILKGRGLMIVGWSVRGFDSFGDDVQRVVDRIVPRVTAGSIVVMHQGRGFSIACVTAVVRALQAKGYVFAVPAPKRLKTKR